MVVSMMTAMTVLMVMDMQMAVLMSVRPLRLCLLLPVHGHCHVGPGDTAGGTLPRLQADTGKSQPVHPVQKCLSVIQQFVKGRHEHVPGCSHVTFYIKCLHSFSSFMPSIWLILLAR